MASPLHERRSHANRGKSTDHRRAGPKLRESKGAVVLDYRGLHVSAITQLRREAGDKTRSNSRSRRTPCCASPPTGPKSHVSPELLRPAQPPSPLVGETRSRPPERLAPSSRAAPRGRPVKGGIIGGRALSAGESRSGRRAPAARFCWRGSSRTMQVAHGQGARSSCRHPPAKSLASPRHYSKKRESTGEAA